MTRRLLVIEPLRDPGVALLAQQEVNSLGFEAQDPARQSFWATMSPTRAIKESYSSNQGVVLEQSRSRTRAIMES
jgi:hypothetical protein